MALIALDTLVYNQYEDYNNLYPNADVFCGFFDWIYQRGLFAEVYGNISGLNLTTVYGLLLASSMGHTFEGQPPFNIGHLESFRNDKIVLERNKTEIEKFLSIPTDTNYFGDSFVRLEDAFAYQDLTGMEVGASAVYLGHGEILISCPETEFAANLTRLKVELASCDQGVPTYSSTDRVENPEVFYAPAGFNPNAVIDLVKRGDKSIRWIKDGMAIFPFNGINGDSELPVDRKNSWVITREDDGSINRFMEMSELDRATVDFLHPLVSKEVATLEDIGTVDLFLHLFLSNVTDEFLYSFSSLTAEERKNVEAYMTTTFGTVFKTPEDRPAPELVDSPVLVLKGSNSPERYQLNRNNYNPIKGLLPEFQGNVNGEEITYDYTDGGITVPVTGLYRVTMMTRFDVSGTPDLYRSRIGLATLNKKTGAQGIFIKLSPFENFEKATSVDLLGNVFTAIVKLEAGKHYCATAQAVCKNQFVNGTGVVIAGGHDTSVSIEKI